MRKRVAALLLAFLLLGAFPVRYTITYAASDADGYLARLNALIPKPFINGHEVTREEFFATAACLFIPDEPSSNDWPFADANLIRPENVSYLDALYRRGILAGAWDNGQLVLLPSKQITRQEAVTVMGRLLAQSSDGELTFMDQKEIQPYAYPYVAWFTERGIIEGYSHDSFNPEGHVTSEQLAVLMIKTLDYWQSVMQTEMDTQSESLIENAALTLSETSDLSESEPLLSPAYRPGADITVTVLSGTGTAGAADGIASSATYNLPQALFDGGYDLFIADTYNNLIRLIRDGNTECVSGRILGYDNQRFPKGYYQDGDSATALFNRPADGVTDTSGRVFIVDSANHAIRIIYEGRVTTYSGGSAGYANGSIHKALFNTPSAIAADSAGNLFIADTLNHCIRKIDANGLVTTLAGTPGKEGRTDGPANQAMFRCPAGIDVREDGAVIYVSDTGNHRICKIENGEVATLAGFVAEKDADGEPLGAFADGMADESLFSLPMGLSFTNGMLIVADSGNHRIRAITQKGEVITLAGTGEPGDRDGYAADAQFNLPMGVCVINDILYIADTCNQKIKQMRLDTMLFE